MLISRLGRRKPLPVEMNSSVWPCRSGRYQFPTRGSEVFAPVIEDPIKARNG